MGWIKILSNSKKTRKMTYAAKDLYTTRHYCVMAAGRQQLGIDRNKLIHQEVVCV